jgi:hypothetical protein
MISSSGLQETFCVEHNFKLAVGSVEAATYASIQAGDVPQNVMHV